MTEYKVHILDELKQFYLVCQPIVRIQANQLIESVADYEVLIRSRRNDKFPFETFRKLIESETYNDIFIKWFEKEFRYLLQKFPDYKFDINIDPQQFKYPRTWVFINNISDEHQRIAIEITETIPLNKEFTTQDEFFKKSPLAVLKKIGFKTVIDDIGTGQNSLQLVANNLEKIDRLKISLLAFRGLRNDVIFQFLEAWFNLANKYNFEFVVEGIDNKTTARKLISSGLIMQQGFFWQKPRVLEGTAKRLNRLNNIY
ncbi:EAL domain-containing protein [Liquorilactobacillus mali]|uniref:EAL domain-containing protein n=1 Tax=Liquorilactobacillus mali TaxID=1618 RepID=UPI0026533D6E|nr:EAL domain-containing protein [Liquorilactobacillus mali]MDN7145049.1 EAL domain-containing protein [Liquorilactobacillus mali]